MNYKKIALINRRDELFDSWLDNYDKLQKWKLNGDDMLICKISKARNHKKDVIMLLEEQLRKTSMHLRILDAEITAVRPGPDKYYSILEIN